MKLIDALGKAVLSMGVIASIIGLLVLIGIYFGPIGLGVTTGLYWFAFLVFAFYTYPGKSSKSRK